MTIQHTAGRIAPAPAEQVRALVGWDNTADEIDPEGPKAHIVGKPVPNVLGVLGNHAELLAALHPLLAVFDPESGVLPVRESELVILRVGYLLRAPYEWAHHAAIATKVGLTEQDLARIPAGPDAPGWSEFDAALLRAVDELRGPQAKVSDRTWTQLSVRYHNKQLLELVAQIGIYTMLAYVLNSCEVPIDEWFIDPPALPEA